MNALANERSGLHGALDRALRLPEIAAAFAGGFAMVTATVLTSVDALMRYLFNAPLTFNAYLTTYYLMVAMLILPMAWAYRNGGYIRFVFLLMKLPKPVADLVLRAGQGVSAVYFGALTWFSWGRFWEHYSQGDVQMGEIDWPVSWSWICIPIGLGLLSLRLLLTAFGPSADLHYTDLHNEEAKEKPL